MTRIIVRSYRFYGYTLEGDWDVSQGELVGERTIDKDYLFHNFGWYGQYNGNFLATLPSSGEIVSNGRSMRDLKYISISKR